MKILNAYAGIGGNRKYWSREYQVTAIEKDPLIAALYKKLYPQDIVIVGDAHEYILKHYNKYDFIWSSPVCVTHTSIRKAGVNSKRYEAKYPDMSLYQEIIFLKEIYKGKWVVENVKPYYQPLIKPDRTIGRHIFWANFPIGKIEEDKREKVHQNITGNETIYGFNVKREKLSDKRAVIRNLVSPSLGNHILNSAIKLNYQPGKQLSIAF